MRPLLLIVIACALAAAPATRPTTKPATRPSAAKPPAAKPAATRPAVAPRPAPAQSPELWRHIAQRRDRQLRYDTLSGLRAMLEKNSPADQLLALRTLSQVSQIKFDREPFHALIRRLLRNPDAEVRAAALQLLPAYDANQDDLAPVSAMANDPSPRVRAQVPGVLAAANGRIGSMELDAAMLQLLDDPDASVVREVVRAVAGVDVSEAVEAKLIKLSYDPKLGRDTSYHALASRPLIREPVARRLIELLEDADQAGMVNRVAWGLRNDVVPEAVDAVRAALLRTLDDSLNSNVRDNCIVALGRWPTEQVADRLQAIASDPEEEDRIRNVAARVLRDGR